MTSQDGYDSPLVGEVLSDVAQTFFGSRKALDDMIDILKGYADLLRKKGREVEKRASLIRYLLVREELTMEFYGSIGVESPGDLISGGDPPQAMYRRVPFGLTARGRFVRVLLQAYKRLQEACREYRCSSAHPLVRDKDPMKACVDYRLVASMCELVNQKIKKINEELSPSVVLQYAKGFDTEGAEKARVTGATAGEYIAMDQKYCYRPIHFQELELKNYPELPDPGRCGTTIEKFCKRVYPHIADEANARINRLVEASKK